jgi:hypothetical protein
MSESGLFASTKGFSWGNPGEGLGVGFRNAVVLSVGEVVQATKYNPNENAPKELDFFPSGDKKLQIPVTILTDLRDPSIPGDNGHRVVYLTQGSGRFKKTRELMRIAGRNGDPQKGDIWSLGCIAEDMSNRGKMVWDGAYSLGTPESIAIADRELGVTPAASGMFSGAPAATPAPAPAAPAANAFAGQVHDTVPAAPAAAPVDDVAAQIAALQAQLAAAQGAQPTAPAAPAAPGRPPFASPGAPAPAMAGAPAAPGPIG